MIWLLVSLCLVTALWVNPGALSHVRALFIWTVLALLLDLAKAYEMKLFLDAFGFLWLVKLTIGNITKGMVRKSEALCTSLAFSQVIASAAFWGAASAMRPFGLPLEVFSALLMTYGWVLNALFVASILVLCWGVNIRDRLADLLSAFGRVRAGLAGLLAVPKAYVRKAFYRTERSA